MSVSIIIPTLHDCRALTGLLDNLQRLDPAAEEIIVVDGAADAQCRRLCEQYGVRWLDGPACRGHQLDAGARSAHGEVLWFLHADSRVRADALQHMIAHIKTGAIGGYFRFRFSGARNARLRWFEAITNWRSRVGVAYGDQGLFMTAKAYREHGGFQPQPLFEEVRLFKRLRSTGRFRRLSQPLATSPRRWQRDGWWRRTLINRILALGYALGIPAARLHKWYTRHRRPDADEQHQSAAKTSAGS